MAVIATRIRSFAPQLLVDDLEGTIKFYSEVLGFSFGPPWGGFYAIGERDGFDVPWGTSEFDPEGYMIAFGEPDNSSTA